MIIRERRTGLFPERRAFPRGGRRPYDLPGSYPPVLIAESYVAVREPCVTYLQSLRFDVAEAARPTEALAILEAGWAPHVILADSASADALAPRLVGPRRTPAPRLIVMSGSPDVKRPPRSALLVKPFHLKTMVQTIRRVLRHAAAPRRKAKA